MLEIRENSTTVTTQPASQVEGRFNETSRDITMDTVRGIAIVLLVLFHVVGYGTTGLKLDDDHPLRQFNAMLVFVRMPLFTILSGYVYALRPYAGDPRRFVGGKARRLLIPLVVVGTAFFAIQAMTPGANAGLDGTEWRTIHIQPVAHFWFLQALFWVFLVVMVLERLGRLATIASTATVLVGTGLASAVYQPPATLGFAGALYLVPFFIFGLGLKRFDVGRSNRSALMIGVAVMVVSLGFCVAGVLDVTGASSRTSIAALVAGCSSGLVLLRSGARSSGLATLGLFSYTVYLFHTFATAASRISLEHLGLDIVPLQIAVGMCAGISIPIGIDLIARRNSLSRQALLGRTRRELTAN